jgi:hypothetical protein
MTPFLYNLLLFSPLLGLGALILYVLERADTLRRGAGLLPPEPNPPPLEQPQPDPQAETFPQNDPDSDIESDTDELLERDPLDAPFDDDQPQQAQAQAQAQAPAQQQRRAPRTRTVGTKKARSLARRDQRRAYHEFMHSQQSARAAENAALAEEEEERVFEEKRRRALAEDEIIKRKERERAERLERERKEREEYARDVDALKTMVGVRRGERQGRRGWKIEELAGRRGTEWVRETLRLEGLVGIREGGVGMITGDGWYVVLGEQELGKLYEEMERRGRMDWGEMASVLERAIEA